MPPVKPSLDLLRSLSDEHVLRALMSHDRLTRAEIAALTGISKPTASESIRRLTVAGIVEDTGARTTGRGRVGSYFALAPGVGCALAVSIAPEGIVAETVAPSGAVTSRATRTITRPATPRQVTRALTAAARQALEASNQGAGLAVVSAADPVDRHTGRLVHLPDAPFLVGELSPADALAPLVHGPVVVDNDVNWAARAEQRLAPAMTNFAYLYLGEGLGAAVVSDGEVVQGHRGFAGEIAHLVTVGPKGEAMAFTEVFAALGLHQPGTATIDVDAVLDALRGSTARHLKLRAAIAAGVAGVLAGLLVVTDPEVVVVGGPWGSTPELLQAVQPALDDLPRRPQIRTAAVAIEAALVGVRRTAVDELRTAIVRRAARFA
jgi:predicted NBD/HSP70 family sugar kinase